MKMSNKNRSGGSKGNWGETLIDKKYLIITVVKNKTKVKQNKTNRWVWQGKKAQSSPASKHSEIGG